MARKKLGSVKRTNDVLITSVDLASADVTGVLPVAGGGTGFGTFVDGDLLVGETTGNTLKKLAKPSTDGHVLTYDGSTGDIGWEAPPAGGGGGGGPDIVKITADQAMNGIAVADVTGLKFTLVSGSYYRFSFFVVWQTATVSVGLRVALTHPGASIFAAVARIEGHGANGTDAEFQGRLTASGTEISSTAAQEANTNYIAEIIGFIKPNANGDLQVRVGNETATNNITVKDGSHGLLWTL